MDLDLDLDLDETLTPFNQKFCVVFVLFVWVCASLWGLCVEQLDMRMRAGMKCRCQLILVSDKKAIYTNSYRLNPTPTTIAEFR